MKKIMQLKVLALLALATLLGSNAQAMSAIKKVFGKSSSSKEAPDDRLTRKIEEFSRAQAAARSGEGSPRSRDARAAELKSALSKARELKPEHKEALAALHQEHLPQGKERITSAHQPYSVRKEIEKAIPELRDARLTGKPVEIETGTARATANTSGRSNAAKEFQKEEVLRASGGNQQPKPTKEQEAALEKMIPAAVKSEQETFTQIRSGKPTTPSTPATDIEWKKKPAPANIQNEVSLAEQERDAKLQQSRLMRQARSATTDEEKQRLASEALIQGEIADKASRARAQLAPKPEEKEVQMTGAALQEAIKKSPREQVIQTSPQQREAELKRIDAEGSKPAPTVRETLGAAQFSEGVTPLKKPSSGVTIGDRPISSEPDKQIKQPTPSSSIDDIQPIKRPTPVASETTKPESIPSTLAEEIQKGKSLKKVDLDAVAQEKKAIQDPAAALNELKQQELEKRRQAIEPSKADKKRAKLEEEAFWATPAA